MVRLACELSCQQRRQGALRCPSRLATTRVASIIWCRGVVLDTAMSGGHRISAHCPRGDGVTLYHLLLLFNGRRLRQIVQLVTLVSSGQTLPFEIRRVGCTP